MLKIPCIVLALALAPQAALAQGSGRSAEQIVQAQCAKCHETGENGAPRIGDREAWVPRLRLGLDAVIAAATKGHGNMPARGGMADLTDPEFRSAVVYLINRGSASAEASAARPLASDPHRKVVGDTEILLGVVTAEALRARGADGAMHGGAPKGKGYYHVNISLHDVQTNAEIRNAEVQARVSTPLRGETRKLERMTFDKSVSYGNYFRMPPGKDPYTISVLVRRPGASTPVEAKFDFRPY